MRRRTWSTMMVVTAVCVAGACGSSDDSGSAASDTAPVTNPAVETTAAPTTTGAPETTPAAETETTEAPTTTVAAADAPALTVDTAAADAAVACDGDGPPVLLVHGTGSSPEESFGPGIQVWLPGEGFEVCTVALPDRAVGDIQVSAQYVVNAVRTIGERTGADVAVLSHSQGVLVSRWAIAQYPDVAETVSMLIAMAGPNAGAPSAAAFCAAPCAPALHQMLPDSAFLQALDAAWADVDVPVTVVRTLVDELVPAESAAALDGTLITTQDTCPDQTVSHVELLAHPLVNAAIIEALTNDGVVRPDTLTPELCSAPLPDGVDVAAIQSALDSALASVTASPTVTAEPPVVVPS